MSTKSKTAVCWALAVMSACASLAAQKTPRTKTHIETLLGKYVNDGQVQSFVKERANKLKFSSYPDKTYYYSFKAEGVSLMFDQSNRITTIFLYSEGHEGFKQFTGTIPRGLKFNDTRSTVNQKLGLPSSSGGGSNDALGRIPIWDRYEFSEYSLHVSYHPAGTVQQITLMMRSP